MVALLADRPSGLDRMLDPLRDVLTPDVARAIVALRADTATQDRIEELAEGHHEGRLGADELADYESLVRGANLVAVFQAKARSALNRHSAK